MQGAWDETQEQYRKKVDFISLNYDNDRVGKYNLFKVFGVSKLPTIIVLDRNGDEVKRFEGWPPEGLDGLLDHGLSR